MHSINRIILLGMHHVIKFGKHNIKVQNNIKVEYDIKMIYDYILNIA